MSSLLGTWRRRLAGLEHKSPHVYLYLVLAVLLAVIVCNALWEEASCFCMRNDAAMHAYIAAYLRQPGSGADSYPYPHLVHAMANWLIQLMGCSQWPYFIVLCLFLTVHTLGMYVAGCRLLGRKVAALACIVFLGGSQVMFGLRTFYLDYALASLFIWQYAAYLYSERFTRWVPSLFFLLCIPVGFFIKTQYIVFLAALSLGIIIHLLPRQLVLWQRLGGFILLLAGPVLGFMCTYRLGQFTLMLQGIVLGLLVSGFLLAFLHLATGRRLRLKVVRSRPVGYSWRPLAHFVCGLAFLCSLTLMIQLRLKSPDLNSCFANNVLFSAEQKQAMESDAVRAAFPLADFYDDVKFFGSPSLAWQLSSMILRGHLLDVKCRLMSPLTFWMYLLGLIWIWIHPAYRRRWTPALCCILVCPLFFLLVTTDNVRYQAPVLAMRCLVAFCFWKVLRPRLLQGALVVLLLYGGLYLNAGWLLSAGNKSDPAYIQNEILGNNMAGSFVRYDKIPIGGGACRFLFSPESRTANFFTVKSVWHDKLFYTVPAYSVDYQDFVRQVRELTPNGVHFQGFSYLPTGEQECQVMDVVELEPYFGHPPFSADDDSDPRPEVYPRSDLATTFTFFNCLEESRAKHRVALKTKKGTRRHVSKQVVKRSAHKNVQKNQDRHHKRVQKKRGHNKYIAVVHYQQDKLPALYAQKGGKLFYSWHCSGIVIDLVKCPRAETPARTEGSRQ